MLKKIASSILILSSFNLIAGEKELTFYKDLANYKELSEASIINNKIHINLSDTAVLDTFNVTLIGESNNLIQEESVEIHPKSEENIFKLNKNQTVFINDKEYILIENGKGFIKVKNEKGYITFIPKNKISEISFTNDLNATTHMAQVTPLNKNKDVKKIAFSYALGEIDWSPKYDLYLKNNDTVQLDYNIEIDNQTLSSFENVNVKFMLEKIDRYYNSFISSNNGGIFDYEQFFVLRMEENAKRPREIVYDQYGFSRDGFDKAGYNSIGVSRTNEISTVLENGKRAFKFSNQVNIPAKAKTIYPFKSAIEMSYKRENILHLNNLIRVEDVFLPNLNIKVKNNTGISFSSGVLRVFSNSKGYNATVIKETKLNANVDDEDIEVNLGSNYGIKVKAINKDSLIQSKNMISDSSFLYAKTIGNKNNFAGWNYSLDKVKLNISNESNEKDLTIKSQLILNENKKDWLISKLKTIKNGTESYEDVQKIHKEILDTTVEFKNIQLKESQDIEMYILRISKVQKSDY